MTITTTCPDCGGKKYKLSWTVITLDYLADDMKVHCLCAEGEGVILNKLKKGNP
jgi:hypothetical protein